MQQKPLRHIIQSELVMPQVKAQQQDVQCCQTKIIIWQDSSFQQFQSDYLNQIFPYKLNRSTMSSTTKWHFHFLSSSMYYWVELIQSQKEQGKLGLNDAKFIKQIFQEDQTDNYVAFRRWGERFMKKEQFLLRQQEQANWQPPRGGSIIHEYKRNDALFQIRRYTADNKQFNQYRKRIQVMLLFYIDGVSFVNQQVDTWVYFLIFKKVEQRYVFVGILSEYIFKLSATKQRHRISQVFILPQYQKQGHGKQLLDTVYKISLSDPLCFQITTQIPSFQYQCLRDFKQCQMILSLQVMSIKNLNVIKTIQQIKQSHNILLSKQVLREIKSKLKLPGHQIQRIAHIFIYNNICQDGDDFAKAHFQEYLRQKIIFNRSPFKSRQKLPHITFFGESPEMKQFYLEKAKQDFLRNQTQIQQLLTQTIDGYIRVINKLHKTKKL